MSITTYEDLTLLDPRPAPLDDELRRLCAAFRARPAGIRNSLTADDLYTLLVFARRAAVFAMRERDAAWIADGLTAVALIDDERIDDRGEIARTLGLLHHAAMFIGADAAALFAAAAKQATRSVARAFRQPRFSGYDATAAGFVRRDANEYRPAHDLLRTALEIRAMLDRDRYRVDDVVLATALPEVWFDAPPRPAGVVTIGARHRDDAQQVAIAFVAELDEPPRVADAGDVASVAVVEGNLLCLLVASHETTASLQRFAAPMRHALAISPITPAR
jgi:hypothetical protein